MPFILPLKSDTVECWYGVWLHTHSSSEISNKNACTIVKTHTIKCWKLAVDSIQFTFVQRETSIPSASFPPLKIAHQQHLHWEDCCEQMPHKYCSRICINCIGPHQFLYHDSSPRMDLHLFKQGDTVSIYGSNIICYKSIIFFLHGLYEFRHTSIHNKSQTKMEHSLVQCKVWLKWFFKFLGCLIVK